MSGNDTTTNEHSGSAICPRDCNQVSGTTADPAPVAAVVVTDAARLHPNDHTESRRACDDGQRQHTTHHTRTTPWVRLRLSPSCLRRNRGAAHTNVKEPRASRSPERWR